MRHRDALAGLERQKRVVRAFRLGAENADRGIHGFGDGGGSGKQAAAAHGRNQRVERSALFKQLESRRALPGHDQRMVERRHQRGAGSLQNAGGDLLADLGVPVVSHNGGAVRARRFHLGARRILRHHDGGTGAHVLGRDRHCLGVVARRVSHHAALERVRGKRKNQVGRSADFEGSAALQVLALEEHARSGAGIESRASEDRCAARQRAYPLRRLPNVVGLDG